MDAHGEVRQTTFEDTTFLVGGVWKTTVPKYPLFPSLWAMSEAKSAKMPLGAYHVCSKGQGVSKTSFQCVMMAQDDSHRKMKSGALSIALNAHRWPAQQEGKTSVLILPTSDVLGASQYWLVAISPNGTVISEYEKLYASVYDVTQGLSDIELTESPTYYYLEGDIATATLLEQHKERSLIEFSPTALPGELIKSSLQDSKAEIKQLYKESSIELKKAGTVTLLVSAIIAGYFGYTYIDTRESMSWLSDEAISSDISQQKLTMQKMADEFKKSKSWTPMTYKDTTLEQFVSNLPTGYSPPEIALTIQEIERVMPLFVADWSMTKIAYDNGDFFVRYERDRKGKGVFFLLDKSIIEIQKRQPDLNVEGYALLNNAEVRVYRISKRFPPEKGSEKALVLKRFEEEKNVQNELKRSLQRAIDYYNQTQSLRDEANTLTFKERWITKRSKDLYEEAMSQLETANDEKKKAKDIATKLAALPKASIREDWVLGSVLEFVTLMQTDSLFTWSYPEIDRTFPDSKLLKEREPKKRKSKSKRKSAEKQEETYSAAIETYKVEVSTQTSEEIGKVMSYGVLDMLQLSLLIDRPFINVTTVEYDPNAEQWKLVLLFNRKTPEFDARITSLTQG